MPGHLFPYPLYAFVATTHLPCSARCLACAPHCTFAYARRATAVPSRGRQHYARIHICRPVFGCTSYAARLRLLPTLLVAHALHRGSRAHCMGPRTYTCVLRLLPTTPALLLLRLPLFHAPFPPLRTYRAADLTTPHLLPSRVGFLLICAFPSCASACPFTRVPLPVHRSTYAASPRARTTLLPLPGLRYIVYVPRTYARLPRPRACSALHALPVPVDYTTVHACTPRLFPVYAVPAFHWVSSTYSWTQFWSSPFPHRCYTWTTLLPLPFTVHTPRLPLLPAAVASYRRSLLTLPLRTYCLAACSRAAAHGSLHTHTTPSFVYVRDYRWVPADKRIFAGVNLCDTLPSFVLPACPHALPLPTLHSSAFTARLC